MEQQTAVLDRSAIRDDRIVPKGKDEIDALTGVRGAAAVIVIAYHSYPAADFPYGISHLVARGYLAVDIFFVLSGFVMALTYGSMFRNRVTLPSFFTFLMRRVARLYPLYITFLALRIAYSLAVYGSLQVPGGWFAMNLPMPVKDIIANIFMIQSWGVAKAVTTPTWSISTEWGAYFVFPFIVGGILFRRTAYAMLSLLAAATLIIAAGALTGYDGMHHNGALDAYDGRTFIPMLRCLGGFTFGLLTYRLYQWPPARRCAASGIGWAVLAYLMLGLLLHLPDQLIYPAFPLLVLCLACDRGALARVFSCKPLMQLGVLSYTIYVIHNVWIGLIHWLIKHLPSTMPTVVAQTMSAVFLIASLYAVGHVLHHWVEVPGRSIVRRLGDRTVAWLRPQAQPRALSRG
ncbi:acyltransferase family protein [Acidisoma silvae]|uniref:Acyltransferase n=1 Tax=Acidisoma silvae TaxID=2802396 RepID=A0A963YRT6_9PROT|nr:acyltransferase [Acidisoma silvae]MCB8875797.1 acyltransferase [Acidisoma silvae]